MFEENKGLVLPACKQNACPVQELATDAAVNNFLDRFRMARAIYDRNGIESILEHELEALGLLEDKVFLLELETILAEAKAAAQKPTNTSQTKLKWKR